MPVDVELTLLDADVDGSPLPDEDDVDATVDVDASPPPDEDEADVDATVDAGAPPLPEVLDVKPTVDVDEASSPDDEDVGAEPPPPEAKSPLESPHPSSSTAGKASVRKPRAHIEPINTPVLTSWFILCSK